MKKKQLMTGLLTIGMVSALGLQAPKVLAEEQSKTVATTESSEQEVTQETTEEEAEKPVSKKMEAATEKPEAAAGTFGTVPWTWDAETQTVTFGAGEFPNGWSHSENIDSKIQKNALLEGKQIKKIIFTDKVIAHQYSRYLFKDLKGLQDIAHLEFLDTSNTTDMSGMFANTNLSELDLSHFDTSNTTNMSEMFANSKLTKIDLSSFKTNKANTKNMFKGSTELKTLILGEGRIGHLAGLSGLAERWVLSSEPEHYYSNSQDLMKNYDGTKPGEYVLDKKDDGIKRFGTVPWSWDAETQTITFGGGRFYRTGFQTSNINDVIQNDPLLEGQKIKRIRFTEPVKADKIANSLFTQLNLEEIEGLDLLDTSETEDIADLFYHSNVQKIDWSKLNTSHMTSIRRMFYGSKFTELDLTQLNVSNVKDMSEMFYYVHASKIDMSGWDTSRVENMQGMFGKTTIGELNIGSWDTRSADQAFMFNDHTMIKSIHLGKDTIFNSENAMYFGPWTLVSPDVKYSINSLGQYDGSKPGKYVFRQYEDDTEVWGIELTPATLELTVSEEATLTSKVMPENATNKKVSYTTSDEAVATVSPEGVVKAISKGTATITASTEDGGFQATSTVTVTAPSALSIDSFYLGIDSYVTGVIETNIAARKVQLVVNGEVVSTATVARDGSFELDTEGTITKTTDMVEVVALDRKNKEVDRNTVSIEEKEYSVIVHPYTLFEDLIVSGKTDYFHTHVALVVNGEEIERKLLTSTREFNFDVEGLIEYADDEVEIVGYRYEEEITRKEVVIQEPTLEMNLASYKLNDPYVTGSVKGKTAKSVRLYVNRRRQQTAKVAEDGTFSLLGIAILSSKDKVEVAVLNDAGIEMARFAVTVTN